MQSNTSDMTITSLNIYPIKGCLGVSLPRATICAQGLLHDRTFLVVSRRTSTSAYETVDIKKCPGLVHVQPSIVNSRLRITHLPSQTSIEVDLEPDRSLYKELNDTVKLYLYPYKNALDLGTEAGRFFQDVVGVRGESVRLCFNSGQPRFIAGNLPPTGAQNGREEIQAGLHSLYPLLITNDASLNDLNSRLPEGNRASMAPFRSNIILDGNHAWDEDDWMQLKITSSSRESSYIIHIVARCPRCVITSVDLNLAKIGNQPIKELRTFRKIDDGDDPTSPVFGMYGVFDDVQGIISVGDIVSITKRTDLHKFVLPKY